MITWEQVRETVKEQNIKEFALRTCSICEAPLFYRFSETNVVFDSSCDCGYGRENVRQSSYEQLAEYFNRQTDEIGAREWKRFTDCGTKTE